MQTNRCPSHERLAAFVLGKLPEDQAVQLAEHAGDCPNCQAQLHLADQWSDDLIVQIRQTPLPDAITSEPALSSLLPRIETLGRRWEELSLEATAAGGGPTEPSGWSGQSADELTGFLAPPQSADELGRLGTYRVLKVLGRGGMGVVFMAHDPTAQRGIALKVMLPEMARKPDARDRFLREAHATARIQHDHIVALYQVSEDRGVPFLAMPLLVGATLEDWLAVREQKKEPIPLPRILRIGRETALGLAAAHAHGLIHRDIKPANLWLDSGADDRIKILDFGLARPVGDAALTQPGMVVGTAAYMAPEQARGLTLDHRVDLYSLGCVLYRLCAGRLPFVGSDSMSVLIAATTEEAVPVGKLNPTIPPALGELVMQLLAKDPTDRPATAQDVADRLRNLELQLSNGSAQAQPRPRSARGAQRLLVGLAAAVVLLAGGLIGYAVFFHKSSLQVAGASDPTGASQPDDSTPGEQVADAEFFEKVAKMGWFHQMQNVNVRMQRRNPGFEILERKKGFWLNTEGLENKVRKVEFRSDAVTDVSALAVVTDLVNLNCAGSKPGLGKLSDLRPLKDLKLVLLNISNTEVQDLTPLQGMADTLTHLNCQNTRVRNFAPLKDFSKLIDLKCDPPTAPGDREILSRITSLKVVNGQPKREFLFPKKP